MEQSNYDQQSTDVRSVLLDSFKARQKNHKEGSVKWYEYQEKINQIVAANFLEYVNR